MDPLTDEQLLRYARNILLPTVDIAGQSKLLDTHVAVVGAGGLGSPVLQYLAASGVGELTIIDDDVVDETNLQRQVIHQMQSVGRAKVDSAATAIQLLNPEITIHPIQERLVEDNIDALLADADLVVIGTDNFASRYLVNKYCRVQKRPMVSGAAIGTSGQLTSFNFQETDTPCFQCVYEDMGEEAQTCATAGVLGPVVGTIGSMMALECIKIVLGIGRPLFGRLIIWDALSMEWQSFNYQTSEQCPVCSQVTS
jgi:adenylyltransferase/sulfurtransferase